MPTSKPAGITVRAFLLGTLVSLLIGVGIIYGDNVVRGSRMGQDFGSPVALFILFILVAFLNPLLGWLRRSWYLSVAEITLVYIMALTAATIPSMGLTAFFIPYLSGAQYYARPENRWSDLFDDSNEVMSYRAAVLAVLGGTDSCCGGCVRPVCRCG